MKNTNLLATIVAGLTLLCLWLPANAQHPCQEDVFQNSLWSSPELYLQFDDIIGVSANTLPIPPDAIQDVDYMGQQATNAHNAMHDQNGALEFFIVNGVIYDGEGYTIAEM